MEVWMGKASWTGWGSIARFDYWRVISEFGTKHVSLGRRSYTTTPDTKRSDTSHKLGCTLDLQVGNNSQGHGFWHVPLAGDHLQTSPDSRNSKASMTCPCCWHSAPGRKYSGPWGFSWAGLESWLQWLPTKSFGTFESAMESRPESEDLKNSSGIDASFICPSLEFGHTKSVENLNGQDCELKKVLNCDRHGGLW